MPHVQRAARATGFTLVELLTVIMIITLLLAILLPTIGKVRLESMVHATRAIIGIIDGAVRSYEVDFHDYPPSAGGGSQQVVLYLTGYAGDPDDNGAPVAGGLATDDGKDGFGFRLKKGGRVYGPYNGTEKLEMFKPQGSAIPSYFTDSFGRAILYYRFDRQQKPPYNNGDNAGGPADINEYVKNKPPPDGDGKYRAMDFLLLSAGADGKYTDPKTDPTSDDITNYQRQ